MHKDDFVYINHILDASAKIEEYLKGVNKKKFLNKSLVQDAILHEIQIIGEAIRYLSKDFRKKHSHVPWKEAAGMRSKLVHDYFGVDLKIVWKAATEDVPKLRLMILDIQT